MLVVCTRAEWPGQRGGSIMEGESSGRRVQRDFWNGGARNWEGFGKQCCSGSCRKWRWEMV